MNHVCSHSGSDNRCKKIDERDGKQQGSDQSESETRSFGQGHLLTTGTGILGMARHDHVLQIAADQQGVDREKDDRRADRGEQQEDIDRQGEDIIADGASRQRPVPFSGL